MKYDPNVVTVACFFMLMGGMAFVGGLSLMLAQIAIKP
jgi:hypothetical protein